MKKYTLSTISASIILFFALPFASFSQDGSLDNTFGVNGIVTTSIGNLGSENSLNGIAIQDDGKIVAAGYSYNYFSTPQKVFALTRYNINGSLDNTFHSDGIVTTSIGTSSSQANGIAIQADGKIVAAGEGNGPNSFALTRYNTNGSLDLTFGTNGIVTTSIEGNGALAIAIQADGKILAAGYSQSIITINVMLFTLMRYNTNGSLDPTFGTDGIVTTSIGEYGSRANGIAIQTDGKIVLAGESQTSGNFSPSVFALSRYNTNGSLDTNFGTAGIVTTSIGINSAANDIVIQADGKILAAGSSDSLGSYNFTFSRYNTNGILDTTFDTDGIVTSSFEESQLAELTAITLQVDGKIVATGCGPSNIMYNCNIGVARYNTNGSLDNTFGVAGIVITAVGDASGAGAIAIQDDGKIVAAGGAAAVSNGIDFVVVRYNNNLTGDISESNTSSQISIYPNPFSKATTLKTDNLFENATFIVYNTLGEQVRKIDNISGQTFTFYRENLEQGIYFYQLKENNIIVSENRFVITD
jgi:uncharacterized delta-60 repeat protein